MEKTVYFAFECKHFRIGYKKVTKKDDNRLIEKPEDSDFRKGRLVDVNA
ncbi:MAG: hypothetical protein V3T88_03195 [Nitrosomonadaceae bacterium]